MLKNTKKTIFEKDFADNFQPNALERLIQMFEVRRSVVMSRLLPKKVSVLVDLACGDGTFLSQNATHFSRGYGFDISEKRIGNAKKALKEFGKKMIFKAYDLDKGIPLKSKSVDTVVCEASLSYFVRPDFVVKEIHRVLKKNGAFIVQIGNYAFLTRRVALLFGQLPKVSSFTGFGDGGMLHYFTYRSLRELLTEKGFDIEVETNSGVVASARKIWPELFAGDVIYKAVKR